jgi:hypothetical protein
MKLSNLFIFLLIVWTSIGYHDVTCYNATSKQCDSGPNIGAYGRVAVGGNPTGFWCAANFLPKGTKIKIPKLTGQIVWTVKDRVNKIFPQRIDLLFPLGETLGGVRKAEVFRKK